MHKTLFIDSWIMFQRCLRISLRNPETLLVATIVPFLLMLLFGNIFGSIVNILEFNYIDFIVPGIILQSVGQASQYSAMNIAMDMSKGMIDRFRSMSISKSAIIIGHTGAGVVRNFISTFVILITAYLLGFRPSATLLEWLIFILLLCFINITISLLAVFGGLLSKSVEGASSFMLPLFILPFISSGFAPVETMTSGVRWFAQIQPMTPMIDSMRSLLLDLPMQNSLWIAITWCVVISAIVFASCLYIYKKKTA